MITRTDGGSTVAVPGHLLSDPREKHFVLRVVGDAMKGEGICDGDFLVVLKRDRAEAGELAIVLIGDESTLRYWCPLSDGMVMLESDVLPAICVRQDECVVHGIPIGLMRKFKSRRAE